MSQIRNKIWHDLADAKCGEEYTILYLARQRTIRKWFKIVTILLSAGGIVSAFKSATIPSIITCSFIGIAQLATSIENHIIHSEEALDNLGKIRHLYYERANKLGELWDLLQNDKISEDEASSRFYSLRESASEIEKLDGKQVIPTKKKLHDISEGKSKEYLTRYHYEQTEQTNTTDN